MMSSFLLLQNNMDIEILFKSPNNNFSQKMEGYLITLVNYYKNDIGKNYDFHKNLYTQLNKEWKCSLSVLLFEDLLTHEETIYGSKTHNFMMKFQFNEKKYKIIVFLYDYSEQNNEILVKSTSGLQYDELNLLKQIVFLTETQTDKVQFLIGVMGKCYSNYDALITHDSPTWVSNMSKKAILEYKNNYYYFAFGKASTQSISLNSESNFSISELFVWTSIIAAIPIPQLKSNHTTARQSAIQGSASLIISDRVKREFSNTTIARNVKHPRIYLSRKVL